MASVSARKVWRALSEVRKSASVTACLCIVGSPELLVETGRLLSAGADGGGLSAAFDVLEPSQFPLRAEALKRWTAIVFLEDARYAPRPELKAWMALCRAAQVPAAVAAVRDTGAVPVDRRSWIGALDLEGDEFVLYTRGTPAADTALFRRIAAMAGDQGLGLAATLPALRPAVVGHIIETTSRQNAAVGVLIFIPGADMPVMTLNQIKMVLKIGAAYGYPPSLDRAVEMTGVIAGGLGFRTLARYGVEFVPGLGWALKGVVGYTATQAIGRAAVAYFEEGAPLTTNRVKRLAQRFRKSEPRTASP